METTPTRKTIAVLGCGPGGMFFVHALSKLKQKLMEENDSSSLKNFPIVKVFERSGSPGGVWKAQRHFQTDDDDDDILDMKVTVEEEKKSSAEDNDTKKEDNDDKTSEKSHSTEMYEALWTNAPKECFEFSDYTFQDHFGNVPLPTYLPRSLVLDYILGRVTHKDPNFFEKDDIFHFQTSVQSVRYNEQTCKFDIEIEKHKNINNGKEATRRVQSFDKCIWAAGVNGKPFIPSSISKILKCSFRGPTLHSSEVGGINFRELVKNNTILLIGSSYSAEDLTLQSIKLGVKKVYILSRWGGEAAYMSSWPEDKAEVLYDLKLAEVMEDGKGLKLVEVEYDYEDEIFEEVENGTIRCLEDVSAVIYCTGYFPNFDMLEKDLRPNTVKEEKDIVMPDNWVMKPNVLTPVLGNIEPDHESLSSHEQFRFFCTYNCLLISNPSMMFLDIDISEIPLLELDITAWSCASYVTGKTLIPSKSVMNFRRNERLVNLMDCVPIRSEFDCSYHQALSEKLPSDHWYQEFDFQGDAGAERLKSYESIAHTQLYLELKWLGLMMLESDYPFQFLELDPDHVPDTENGENVDSVMKILNKYKLNEKALSIIDMSFKSDTARYTLDRAHKDWITFRDVFFSDTFKSIHCKAESVPLMDRWLRLDEKCCDEYLKKDVMG